MSRVLVAALLLTACGGSPAPEAPPPVPPSLFLPAPDFELYVEPQALARDGQALSLSAAQAEGASLGLGKVLVASERVGVHTRRSAQGQLEVGLSISGAPASMGPDDVVDERGERLLAPCGIELRVPCYRDAAAAALPRRIYVLEPREWFVAAGEGAIAHAEAAIARGKVRHLLEVDDRVIWQATYMGPSLRRTIPKLRAGPLAPLAEGLVRVVMSKQRKRDEMDVVAEYTSATAAEEAEPLASRVLSAWSRTREDPRERLVSLQRHGGTLRIRLRGAEAMTAPNQLEP